MNLKKWFMQTLQIYIFPCFLLPSLATIISLLLVKEIFKENPEYCGKQHDWRGSTFLSESVLNQCPSKVLGGSVNVCCAIFHQIFYLKKNASRFKSHGTLRSRKESWSPCTGYIPLGTLLFCLILEFQLDTDILCLVSKSVFCCSALLNTSSFLAKNRLSDEWTGSFICSFKAFGALPAWKVLCKHKVIPLLDLWNTVTYYICNNFISYLINTENTCQSRSV